MKYAAALYPDQRAICEMDLIGLFADSPDLRVCKAGDVIFAEGDPAGAMFVIIEGGVSIQVGDGQIATYGAGEIFGEMALIDPAVRSARAVALDDGVVARVDEQRFKELVGREPGFSLHVMRTLVERLRQSDPRLWREK